MKKRSKIFEPGQRIGDTLLTIVDSASPDNWMNIIVRCECGNELTLPYPVVYACRQYSCGCKKRVRKNAVDYTDFEIYGAAGNNNTGRKVRVLGRDYSTQRWQYMCFCCGETFLLSHGYTVNFHKAMTGIAAMECPNYRRFVPVENIEVLLNEMTEKRGYVFTDIMMREKRAEWLAPYYHPVHVETTPNGRVLGFWGLPDLELPASYKRRSVPYRMSPRETRTSDVLTSEDPDDFNKILN